VTVESGSGRLLLITGSPGSGKTTVIRKVADSLSGLKLGGFYTEEIRVRGERRGFRLVTFDGRERVMAHVGIRGPHRVGKYGVDISAIDQLAESALAAKEETEVYLVDEIGKMEGFSQKFVSAMRDLLDSKKTVIATIGQKGGGFIEEVKQRRDALILEVTRENRDQCPELILAWLESAKGARRGSVWER
jgi:nucleoside-triphosphatase